MTGLLKCVHGVGHNSRSLMLLVANPPTLNIFCMTTLKTVSVI